MTLTIEVSDRSPSTKWSIRLAFFVAIYVAGAFSLNPLSFVDLSLIYAEKFILGIPILLVSGVGIAAFIAGRAAPTRYIIDLFRTRGRDSALVLLFFFAGMIAFSTYKITIPSIVPYYADVSLADLDEWLHGSAPWELAHKLDSNTWSLIVFNSYEVVWFFQWFGTILFVSLWSNDVARIRYLWAATLTMCVLGTVIALALSSVGPIYYFHFVGERRFHGLKDAMDGLNDGYMVLGPAKYLLDAYESGRSDMGGGISSMPSMHVALVALNAFFLTSLNRWLGVLGWAFAALILYGSVYTGWHYAVDGYVSIMVVSVIWWATGRFVRE